MGTILQADDLSVGMLVTVLNAPHYVTNYIAHEDGDTTCQRSVDYSLDGVPLSILAIELPYVVVAHLSGPGRRVVDIRETDLMKISPAYVEALLPTPAKPTSTCNCTYCQQMRKLAEDLKNCAGK